MAFSATHEPEEPLEPAAGDRTFDTDRTFDILSLGTFVSLGLADGMLGVAWPAMRASFGAGIGDLALIQIVATAGSVAVAAFVGRLLHRFGADRLLAFATACAALGALAYGLAPALWFVLAFAAVGGVAAGTTDGGLNTAVGLTGRGRLLNLLHGFYGIGTALGPLAVTVAIVAGNWRPAYLFLAGVDLLAAALWLSLRRLSVRRSNVRRRPTPEVPLNARPAPTSDGAARTKRPGPTTWSGRRTVAVLALGMAVFFVYAGLEVAAGAWEASFARGHLGVSAAAAGLATFGYWGALTAVRLGLALPRRPVPSQAVLGAGCAGALLATGLIWWQPGVPATLAGFALLGAALAGMFPALVAVTPRRIGEGRARHAIAWQTGAAAAGASGLSALVGLLVAATSLAVVAPALAALAVLLTIAVTALAYLAPIPPPP